MCLTKILHVALRLFNPHFKRDDVYSVTEGKTLGLNLQHNTKKKKPCARQRLRRYSVGKLLRHVQHMSKFAKMVRLPREFTSKSTARISKFTSES